MKNPRNAVGDTKQVDRLLSMKERAKKARHKAYVLAAERRKHHPRTIQLTEEMKERQREAKTQAKIRKNNPKQIAFKEKLKRDWQEAVRARITYGSKSRRGTEVAAVFYTLLEVRTSQASTPSNPCAPMLAERFCSRQTCRADAARSSPSTGARAAASRASARRYRGALESDPAAVQSD